MVTRSIMTDGKTDTCFDKSKKSNAFIAGIQSSSISRTSTQHICERSSLHNESDTSKIPVCTAVSSSSNHQVMRESTHELSNTK